MQPPMSNEPSPAEPITVGRPPFDHQRLRVFPLSERKSLTRLDDILRDPDAEPPALPTAVTARVQEVAGRIRHAREHGATVLLIYGAHLLRNGAAMLLERLMSKGWLTHLATNGAGTIHDWEYAWLGRSTESVEENVETGTFGTWDETGRNIHLALMSGAMRGEGYGEALGRFITEDGCLLPDPQDLANVVAQFPTDPLAPAAADLLVAMHRHNLAPGRHEVEHRWKHGSVLSAAFRHGIQMTVHPGVGYDIIACHPMFNGAVIGRAAEIDFKRFAASVERLDHGVVLNIGSAIMGPQVFEKTLSCVHNIRRQDGRPNVTDHSIYVVDLQDGGNWDWSQGEPPKTNPAYYLRFCKSYSRMGGAMHYIQADNASFVHALHRELIQ